MFEKDERIGLMIERLYAACEPLNRGDTLTHEMIRPILGCEPHEEHWPHCLRQVRKRLQREKAIATWPDRTVGYRLLTSEEQLTFLVKQRLKRAFRQQRRALQSVAVLPSSRLTMHQRQLQAFTLDMLKRSQASIRRELRSHEAAIRPSPVLPRWHQGA